MLDRLLGVQVSEATTRRQTEQAGARAQAVQTAQTKTPDGPSPMATARLAVRVCAERSHLGTGTSQPGPHDPGHRKIDEGLTTGVRALKIAGKSTVARDPGIGPFHYPSSGKHMKAFGKDLVPVDLCSFGDPHPTKAGPWMIHDLEAHPKLLLHPVCEGLTSIAAVGPDQLETRHLSGQRLEQELAPCSISDISRQDFDAQQQPLRVHQEMPFSALNFFSPRRSRAHRHARNWF